MLFLDSPHYLSTVFYLLCGHALADYALQPDWMARYKSPRGRCPPQLGEWWWILTAHALINGFMVGLITHWWWLGLWESLVHGWADYQKSLGKLDAKQDQLIHVGSKFLWACWG